MNNPRICSKILPVAVIWTLGFGAAKAATDSLAGSALPDYRVESAIELEDAKISKVDHGLFHFHRSFEKKKEELKACLSDPEQCSSDQAEIWSRKIKELSKRSAAEKITETQNFVNSQYEIRSDDEVFYQKDHWAHPLEFVVRGGDYEDFAIHKMVTLMELGFRPEDLQIAVGRRHEGGERKEHAVLLVRSDDGVFFLDQTREPAKSLGRFEPRILFNLKYQWNLRKKSLGDLARKVKHLRTREIEKNTLTESL